MDPITTAILAVLPSLASEVVKSGVKDAYEGMKAVIRRKWGDGAPRGRLVREFVVRQRGRIDLEYLPAYAPELNPGRALGQTPHLGRPPDFRPDRNHLVLAFISLRSFSVACASTSRVSGSKTTP